VFIGAACDETLKVLAASGYECHREDAGNSYPGEWNAYNPLGGRGKMHGSRLAYAIGDRRPDTATIEYRLPNGTAYSARAHAHIALALAIVDVAKRAQIDYDREAVAIVRQCRERLQGWDGRPFNYPQGFSEDEGARFLLANLPLHTDSVRAIAHAVDSAPATRAHVAVWQAPRATLRHRQEHDGCADWEQSHSKARKHDTATRRRG
jgi:hypothetical protein